RALPPIDVASVATPSKSGIESTNDEQLPLVPPLAGAVGLALGAGVTSAGETTPVAVGDGVAASVGLSEELEEGEGLGATVGLGVAVGCTVGFGVGLGVGLGLGGGDGGTKTDLTRQN